MRNTITKDELRSHCVSVRLSPAELAALDTQRGTRQRGAYLRDCWSNRPLPAVIPAVNGDAWSALSRSAANLNQIAYSLNSGMAPEISVIAAELSEFRACLLRARP